MIDNVISFSSFFLPIFTVIILHNKFFWNNSLIWIARIFLPQYLVYLLCGDRKITSRILLETAVHFFKSQEVAPSNGERSSRYGSFKQKVAIVDGNNRFNPYIVSSLAVSIGMSPTKVLEFTKIKKEHLLDHIEAWKILRRHTLSLEKGEQTVDY